MLQENYAVKGAETSGARSAFDASVARENLAPDIHLRTAVVFYVAIEVFAVASSAYFCRAFYHFVFNSIPARSNYTFAAFVIASLVLAASVTFRNFVAFRQQSRHMFLWRGIGTVLLAFSIFVTMLFFTQSGEAYSRGSLIFQIISVGVSVI